MESIIDKLKPLQYLYNLRTLWNNTKKENIKPTKSLEEEMFWLEEQLNIPSNLRWHNKNK